MSGKSAKQDNPLSDKIRYRKLNILKKSVAKYDC